MRSESFFSFTLRSITLIGAVFLLCSTARSESLADLAEKQNWSEVTSLLTAEADTTVTQVDGTTALHWAAYHDQTDVVKKLLAAGAKAEVANRYGITPLLLACQNGNADIVMMLLDAGANVNATQRGGESALMIAARTGKVETVKALLDQDAKIELKDHSGQTALMWAAAAGNAEVVSLLVERGADLNHRLQSGFTALLFAAREGKSTVVRVLLAAGADVQEAIVTENEAKGRAAPNGASGVLLAAENGYFELAMELIRAGADPNDMRSGFTVLHCLSNVRKPPRGDDEAGQPPPETTGKLSSLDFIRQIVASGADVNRPLGESVKGLGLIDYHGATPFLLACKTADLPMMQLLVELGADPETTNHRQTTSLMAAAGLACSAPDEEPGTEEECVAACEYLISLGADVNAVDNRGETAMHGAAYKSLPKVAKLLAAHGAKINVWNRKNNKGWTPLLIAQGFRPGNFKPSAPTIVAISEVMRASGVEPPPAPDRDSIPKKKGYDNP
jgi:ankyrin repeat protein